MCYTNAKLTTLVDYIIWRLLLCMVEQVLLRRLRRTTTIYGRNRFEHTLFTRWRWQPVLRTSVLGYCRQTQQLNLEHDSRSLKRRGHKRHPSKNLFHIWNSFFFSLPLFYWFAGQEKYRSISQQYLRKADGVLIMYDVTSEMSFLHVRYWVDSVKVSWALFFRFVAIVPGVEGDGME